MPGVTGTSSCSRLVVAAVLAGAAAVIASSAPNQDEDVAQSLATILGWAEPLWRTAFVGALIVAVVIALDVVISRRWDLARDVLVAVLVVFAVGSVLSGVVQSDWFAVKTGLWSRWGFPELRIAAVAAVVAVAGAELVRPVRVAAGCVVGLAALGAVVLGTALPSAALGALALGLGVGALVRLVFGFSLSTRRPRHSRARSRFPAASARRRRG